MAEHTTEPGVPQFQGRKTIRDIADLARVSIATVSRVLNGRPDVALETRENVLVRDNGFRPNRAAREAPETHTGSSLSSPR
jgi:DNA-binding LacI/PurR family transcriptional regulator